MKLVIFLSLVLSWTITTQASEKLYVHSAKAKIKTDKKMSAPDVAQVKRGEALNLVKAEGMWFQVTYKGKPGYISKLFVKKQKPIGQAALFKEAALTKEKSSRKRSSDYAVSGATRGLTANNRVRGQREQYRSDYQTLQDVESFKVPKRSLKSFMKKAGLGK